MGKYHQQRSLFASCSRSRSLWKVQHYLSYHNRSIIPACSQSDTFYGSAMKKLKAICFFIWLPIAGSSFLRCDQNVKMPEVAKKGVSWEYPVYFWKLTKSSPEPPVSCGSVCIVNSGGSPGTQDIQTPLKALTRLVVQWSGVPMSSIWWWMRETRKDPWPPPSLPPHAFFVCPPGPQTASWCHKTNPEPWNQVSPTYQYKVSMRLKVPHLF